MDITLTGFTATLSDEIIINETLLRLCSCCFGIFTLRARSWRFLTNGFHKDTPAGVKGSASSSDAILACV